MAKEEATLLLRIKQVGKKALTSIKNGIANIGKAAGLASTAIGGFVASSVKAFRVQDLAVTQLNKSLVNQGIFTKELSQKYQDMASSLQKSTTFGDEAIITAQGQLQAFLGQKEVTEDLMKATLDFATAQGVDLKTAAGLVGKAIGTGTNALSRYGVEIDTSASVSEKLSAVTEGLTNRFGGQAEAAAEGLGVVTQLTNAFGDFQELVGERFAPIIEDISKKLLKFTEDLQGNKDILDGLVDATKFISQSFVVFKNVIVGVGEVIGNVLGTTFGAVAQVMEGNFLQAFETIKGGFGDTGSIITARSKQMTDELNALDEAFLAKKKENSEKEIELLKESNERKKEIQTEEREARKEQSQEELEEAILQEQIKNDSKLQEQLSTINKEIANEKNKQKQLDLLRQREKLLDQKADQERRAQLTSMQKFEEFINSQKVSNANSVFGQISTLQSSKSKELVAIGKAAGIAQAIINTAQGITLALATFPPPFSFALAGLVGVAGAAQIATISGVALADGGIVKATPGGIPAIIGEGGRDEMVVPLPNDFDPDSGIGGGANITINVMGGMLGDESSAREFAIAVDERLFELRQNNESIAFDEGVT
jgi:hypothetical protein